MTVISGETYSPKTGDTVKLFKDITPETTDEKTITVGINRTIDLNKHLLKTKLTVKGCTVTIKNGTMMPYTNDTTLVVDVGANVTLDSSLTVNASDNGDEAILVGGDSAGTIQRSLPQQKVIWAVSSGQGLIRKTLKSRSIKPQ